MSYSRKVSKFKAKYKCFPLLDTDREYAERGGKIILPPSALDTLSRMNVTFPLMFKLTSEVTKRFTHVGVLEFVAEDGLVYVPSWIMDSVGIMEDSKVSIETMSLPSATGCVLEPLSQDFADISDPKAVMEHDLRNFACLTTGDILSINYNNKIYKIRVVETQPTQAVNIFECDMTVDFRMPDPPTPPTPQKRIESRKSAGEGTSRVPPGVFEPFQGQGYRLDGKNGEGGSSEEVSRIPHPLASSENSGHQLGGTKRKREPESGSTPPPLRKKKRQKRETPRGIPDYNFNVNNLKFIRPQRSHFTQPAGVNSLDDAGPSSE